MLAQRRQLRAVAHHRRARRRFHVPEERHGIEQEVDPLLVDEPAHEEHLGARSRWLRALDARHVDPVGDDLEPRVAGHAHRPCREVRDRHDPLADPARARLEQPRHAGHDRPAGEVLVPVPVPELVPRHDEPPAPQPRPDRRGVERQVRRRGAVDDVEPVPQEEREQAEREADCLAHGALPVVAVQHRGPAEPMEHHPVALDPRGPVPPLPADEVHLVPPREPAAQLGEPPLGPAGRPGVERVVDEGDPHRRGLRRPARRTTGPPHGRRSQRSRRGTRRARARLPRS